MSSADAFMTLTCVVWVSLRMGGLVFIIKLFVFGKVRYLLEREKGGYEVTFLNTALNAAALEGVLV